MSQLTRSRSDYAHHVDTVLTREYIQRVSRALTTEVPIMTIQQFIGEALIVSFWSFPVGLCVRLLCLIFTGR